MLHATRFSSRTSLALAHQKEIQASLDAHRTAGDTIAAAYDGRARRVLGQVCSGESRASQRVENINQAVAAAFYPTEHDQAIQIGIYRRVLELVNPRSGESLLDWGANAGGLAFAMVEQGVKGVNYIARDASRCAIEALKASLPQIFPGQVSADTQTDLSAIEPKSVDHIVALGSLTHWPLSENDGEEHLANVLEHLVSCARKTVTVGVYSETSAVETIGKYCLLSLCLSAIQCFTGISGFTNAELFSLSLVAVQIPLLKAMLTEQGVGPGRWVAANFPHWIDDSVYKHYFKKELRNWVFCNSYSRLRKALNKRGLTADIYPYHGDCPNVLIHIDCKNGASPSSLLPD